MLKELLPSKYVETFTMTLLYIYTYALYIQLFTSFELSILKNVMQYIKQNYLIIFKFSFDLLNLQETQSNFMKAHNMKIFFLN